MTTAAIAVAVIRAMNVRRVRVNATAGADAPRDPDRRRPTSVANTAVNNRNITPNQVYADQIAI